ncbi:hypothetical protein FBUS_03232 [Fasciolopsis buskii]|uniref:Uncharacterized protein n=1 Tax=Fasciolopsis buskii TaxID=27845 RepID=A0A8E0VJF6_9TREM|nr:hypothetical protein FBUS_03232 [Fasciolopsis buski]
MAAEVSYALLNELHETNVEILKRNKSSDAFADSRNAQSDKPKPKSIPIPPTETDLDAVSNPSTSSPSASTKLFRETSRTTDSSGMQYDWGAILDTLDRSDYTGMSNGYSYPPNESDSTSTKSPVPLNTTTNNGNGHSSDLSSPTASEEQSKETRRAAEQAAQQLDDLLFSLGQLKVGFF